MSSRLSFCCCSSFLPSQPLPPPRNLILLPTLPKLILSKHQTCCNFSTFHTRSTSQSFNHIPRSSTSSTSALEEDEQLQTSSLDDLPLDSESNFNSITSGCKACGREEVERGCNGEGRIQGGIATFPGFGWWPIKAYRPCPGFVASGGRYKRTGQSMDEVAFGKGKGEASVGTDAKSKSRKKKQGPSKDKESEPSNAELGDAII